MSIKREYYDSGNLYSEFFEINNKKMVFVKNIMKQVKYGLLENILMIN